MSIDFPEEDVRKFLNLNDKVLGKTLIKNKYLVNGRCFFIQLLFYADFVYYF